MFERVKLALDILSIFLVRNLCPIDPSPMLAPQPPAERLHGTRGDAMARQTVSETSWLIAKGMLKNNLVTFLGASFSELWCSSIPHESHEETC